MGKIILNEIESGSQTVEADISQELKKGINNLKGNFYDLETGGVKYSEIKGSDSFEGYKKITAKLKNFDLNSLTNREKKLSFWINIYNSLVVHGIVELNVNKSVKEISNFFGAVSYNIGNSIFSLDDIEHGILRGNVKKHFLAKRPFSKEDIRSSLVLNKLEPRIHFGLVCGSKSCPPIGTYQEDKIDQQLDLAASSFINGVDVVLDKSKKKLTLSKIFHWYKQDFGNNSELISFIAKYKNDPEEKNFMNENINKISLSYLPYDWNLNH